MIGLNFGPYINSFHNENIFTLLRPCEIYFKSDVRGMRSFSKCASGLAGHRAVTRLPAGSLSRPGTPWASWAASVYT